MKLNFLKKLSQTKEHLSFDSALGNALVFSKEENNCLCLLLSIPSINAQFKN